MTSAEIIQIIKDIIITLGGTSALIVVAAKFMKNRFENYFDKQIEVKADKALKLFESNLEKKKIYYENKISKEMESIDSLVEFYTNIFPLVSILKDTIDEMISNDSPTSSIASIGETVTNLQSLVVDAKRNRVIPEIYLDKNVFKSYLDLLNELEECTSLYFGGINTYDLAAEKRTELSKTIKNASKNIETNIKSLRNSIEKKAT